MVIQSRLPAFLLTRPAAQSLRFAEELRQCFGRSTACTISPLLAPDFLSPPFPAGKFDALIFTSETGVTAFQAHRGRPNTLPTRAFCVGDRTALAAQKAGLEPISANGDAAKLIALVRQAQPAGRLLHICGAQTRGDVAQSLTDAGTETMACVLYQQAARPLSPEAIALLTSTTPVLAPLFSPRSAALFYQQLCPLPRTAPLACIALSPAIAAELSPLPNTTLYIAAKPTAESLIATIAKYYAAA